MANLIREQRLIDNNKRALIKYVFISDGTAASNTTLVDASSLNYALNANGYIMSSNNNPLSNYRTYIKRIFGNGTAPAPGSYYKLQWAGAANSEIIVFASTPFDYNFNINGDSALITNPEANATGDILLSTNNIGTGNTFTLFIELKKDNRDYDAGQSADPTAFNRPSGI
jgi:hypothetical protein